MTKKYIYLILLLFLFGCQDKMNNYTIDKDQISCLKLPKNKLTLSHANGKNISFDNIYLVNNKLIINGENYINIVIMIKNTFIADTLMCSRSEYDNSLGCYIEANLGGFEIDEKNNISSMNIIINPLGSIYSPNHFILKQKKNSKIKFKNSKCPKKIYNSINDKGSIINFDDSIID